MIAEQYLSKYRVRQKYWNAHSKGCGTEMGQAGLIRFFTPIWYSVLPLFWKVNGSNPYSFSFMILKRTKFSSKKGVFGTLDFFLQKALNEFKIYHELRLEVLNLYFNDFYLIFEFQVQNLLKKCHKLDNKIWSWWDWGFHFGDNSIIFLMSMLDVLRFLTDWGLLWP